MVRLMEERGLRGASRGEWKSETVGIDKTAIPLFFLLFIDMVTEMDCCPGDLMLLHEVCFLPFLATLVLFNSFYISEIF